MANIFSDLGIDTKEVGRKPVNIYTELGIDAKEAAREPVNIYTDLASDDEFMNIKSAKPSDATVGDYAKGFAASGLQSLGAIPQMAGEGLAYLANKFTGSQDYQGLNPLEGTAGKIRKSMTPGGVAAMEDVAKGDILSPDTYELPKTPEGMAMMAAQGFGSLSTWVVPGALAVKAGMLAKAGNTAGATKAAKAATVTGAVTGGLSAGGDAAGNARANVEKEMEGRSHDELNETVPIYAEEFLKSGDESQARMAVANRAGQVSGILAGTIGAAAGAVGGKILGSVATKAGIPGIRNISSTTGRIVAGGAAGAVGEGIQEGIEKAGSNVGENLSLGRESTYDVTRNTFPDVLGGALVGGPVGAVGGGMSKPATATVLPEVEADADQVDQPASSYEQEQDTLDSIFGKEESAPVDVNVAQPSEAITPEVTPVASAQGVTLEQAPADAVPPVIAGEPVTDILRTDNTPFPTEKSALLAAKNRKITGVEPVNIGVNEWVLRAPAPVSAPVADDVITPEQETELSALLRQEDMPNDRNDRNESGRLAPDMPDITGQEVAGGALPVEGRSNAGASGSGQTIPQTQAQEVISAPVGFSDKRLIRNDYRQGLVAMANDLTKGGGMALVPREGAVGRSATGDITYDYNGTDLKRTPSLNPSWFQSMAANPETAVSVKDVQNAVAKALKGEKLGVRQQRVIQRMMDTVSGEDRAQRIPATRQALERARTFRKRAMGAMTEDEMGEMAGDKFNELDYPIHWDEETRSFSELADEAREIDEDRAIRVLERDMPDAQAALQLAVIIKEGKRRGQNQAARPEAANPAAITQAGQAQNNEPRSAGSPLQRQTTAEKVDELSDRAGIPINDADTAIPTAGTGNISTAGERVRRSAADRGGNASASGGGVPSTEGGQRVVTLDGNRAANSQPALTVIEQAARNYNTKDQATSYLRKRLNKNPAEFAGELDAAWAKRAAPQAVLPAKDGAPPQASAPQAQIEGALLQPDLLGQDTRKAQAVADTAKAKDEKRSGTKDVSVESGEFFGQNGKLEQDLFQPEVDKAKKSLDAAGVTGVDRTTTIAAVRRGDLTAQDVEESHTVSKPNAPQKDEPIDSAKTTVKASEDVESVDQPLFSREKSLFPESNRLFNIDKNGGMNRRAPSTEAFKEWNGRYSKSKARGIFYHKTKGDFTVFDMSRGDLGAHFGTLKQAEGVTRLEGNDEGTNIMPVRLAIRNPLRLKDTGSFHADAIAGQLVKKGVISKELAARINFDIKGDWTLRNKYNKIVREAIQNKGYDGVVYANEHEGAGDSWIAFEPTQIKSAIGNSGDYDPENPDILFSRDPIKTPVLSHDAVETVATSIFSKLSLGRNLTLSVHRDESTLPPEILAAAKEQGAQGSIGAVYWRNKVHVVSSKMRSSVDVEKAIFHEALGHYGARSLFGKEWVVKANQLYLAMGGEKGVRDFARKAGINMDAYFKSVQDAPDNATKALYLVDELLAHMQGERAAMSLPQRAADAVKALIGQVRQWLSRNGFMELSKLTDYDLSALLKKMRQAATKDKNGTGKDGPMFMAADADPDNADFTSTASESDSPDEVKEGVQGDRFFLPKETRRGKLRRKIQDEAVRWEHTQEAVVEQGGVITEESDVSTAIKLYPGRVAARIQDFNRRVVEPLLEKLAKSSLSMDDVGLYMYALHAKERNAAMAEINPRFPNDGKPGNSGSGMTDRQADQIIKEAKAHPNFTAIENAAGTLRKVIDARLTMLVKEGVMTRSQVEAYREQYKNYVPLKGFEHLDDTGAPQGAGRGMSTGKKVDYRALGRSSMAGDIVQNIIRDTGTAFMLAEKANVGKTVRNFIKANPDEKLWTIEKIPADRVFKKGAEKYTVYQNGEPYAEFSDKAKANEFARQMREFFVGDDITVAARREPGTVTLKEAQFDPTEEVQFIEGGEVVRLQITDPLLVQSYNRLWNQGVSEGLKALNSYNSWLRQMYTQKNPAWFIMNVVRDVQAIVPYLTGEKGFAFALKTLTNLPSAKRAAWNYYHKKPLGPKMDDVMKRYLSSGGSIGFAYVGDIEAKTQELEGLMHRYTDWRTTASHFKAGNIKRGAYDVLVKAINSKGFAWIEALNTSFENMSRLATFKAAIDSGLSDKEAAMLAKHVTVNFNTRGEWGPNMNAVWIFSNAGVQGTRGFGHALFYSKHKKQVWALSSGFLALGIMATMMGDDDDDLIDDADRGKSLTFKFGDTQFKWPLPYGWGVFGGLGQLIGQAIKHPEKHEELAVKMADVTMQHFSPWGNLFSGGEADMANLVNIIPTAPKPFFQAAFNKSSFGGPLYPESPYDHIQPDSEKAWRTTKGTGYDITAKWLNDISGGDSVQEGAVSVSPESIKLGVSTLFGGVGRLVADLFALPSKAESGEVAPENIPIVKSFMGSINSDDFRSRFYDQSKKARDDYETFKAYQKKGDVDSARAYLAEHKAMISLGEMSGSYTKKLKEIKQKEEITKSNLQFTESERSLKLKMLDDEKLKVTKMYNDKFKGM